MFLSRVSNVLPGLEEDVQKGQVSLNYDKVKTVNLALGKTCKCVLFSVLSERKLSLIFFIDENKKKFICQI